MIKRIHRIQFSPGPGNPGGLLRPGPAALLGRALAVVAGGVILLAGLFVSALVFSVLLVVGAVAGGWLWWKTRDLRRDLGERLAQMQRAQRPGSSGDAPQGPRAGSSSQVLDGDFIRETDRHAG